MSAALAAMAREDELSFSHRDLSAGMTQLILILGINLAGLTFALAHARWAELRETSVGEVRRLAHAIERAARGFLASCFRNVLLVTGLVAVVLVLLHVYVWQAPAPSSKLRGVVWSLLGLVFGAFLTSVVAHFSAQLSQKGSLRTVAALPVGTDRTIAVAMHAGGALGLLSECLGVVGILLLFALLRTLGGGSDAPLGLSVSFVLGGFALGATLAALVVQRAGSVYQSASSVGAELAGERDADLRASDPRNPAAIASLVGNHVGQSVSAAVDLFVCTCVANTAVLLLGTLAFAPQIRSGNLGLLLLPLVVKSFGVLASSFGVFVVRTEENSDPVAGVWRGLCTTLVVALGSLLGSTLWLVGQAEWPPFFVAGSLGLLAASASAYLSTQQVLARVATRRPIADALKVGDSALLAEGIGTGLYAVAIPSVMTSLALVGAFHLGTHSQLPWGGPLAVAVSLASMLATGPFMLAVHSLRPIMEGASGIRAVALVAQDPAFETRSQRVQRTSSLTSAFAQSFWTLAGGVAALFAASSLLAPQAGGGTATPPKALAAPASEGLLDAQLPVGLNLAHPVIVYSGLLGAVLVLAYMGGVLQASTRAMRRVVVEVERQLAGFPRERGKVRVPADYIPSYRACIEIVAQSALSRHLVPVLTAVLLPVLLGPAVAQLTNFEAPIVRAALASFVLAGGVTGFMAAFLAQSVHSCLGSVRQQVRGKPGTAESTLQAGSLAELLGAAAGPAAQLVFKAAAIGSLAALPFLS